jgi:hypothetical protein
MKRYICKYCLSTTQNPFAEMLRYKATKHGIKLLPQLEELLATPGISLPYADEISFDEDADKDLVLYVYWKTCCCFNKYGVAIAGTWFDWGDHKLILKTLEGAV